MASPQQMDDTIRRCYDAWKRENLVRTDNIAPGGYVIKFANSPTVRTVSEGMGMGMILMSVMAGHDPNARTYFDGLFKVVRARPAYGPRQPALMDWRLWMDGRSGGDGWPATDGDLDIALGLLMADRQWGSDGQVNYKQEAINTINAIKEWFMYPDGRLRGRPSENTSRTSDFMFGHFRAFKKATGDAIWDAAVEKQIAILQALQANHSPGIGLVPDFCKDTNTSPAPSPGRNPGVGDGTVTDGDYFFNACRCPWRYGSDYVMTGDERMREICRKLVGFLQADSGGNPGSIATGYKLNGTAISRAYSAGGIVGPVLAGAMVDPSFQTFLNNLWSWNTNNFTTHYYDSELQLIPMLLASGNWWTP
ncbi:glycosyl hydrolase family 8 [Ramlibacter tataouinensis]|uniref:glycosyl hydrolase family 8 n=1 Tax=Ramlibacter tataouinensis TaxID=94132 RepID=UPI001D03B66D|nr:glycosyl hydrolase family 8 [Ramlibacter tataouinensis]